MPTMADVVATLSSGKGAKFCSLTYTSKKNGEVARHTLILGASLTKLYGRDIVALDEMLADLKGTALLAATEIRNSRQKSLELGIGNNPSYTCKDVYVHIDGLEGFKVHKGTGALYVMALSEGKVVLQEGTPLPPVTSSEKTIAKRKIEAMIPSAGRIRQFIIKRVTRVAANGETIEIEGDSGE